MSHYATLGVDSNATAIEIKKAYRTLSKKYHPDKNPDGAERFKNIADAYDTLGDEKKRTEYDAYSSNQRFFNGGFGGRENLSDMFDQVFGNAFNEKGSRSWSKSPDCHMKWVCHVASRERLPCASRS